MNMAVYFTPLKVYLHGCDGGTRFAGEAVRVPLHFFIFIFAYYFISGNSLIAVFILYTKKASFYATRSFSSLGCLFISCLSLIVNSMFFYFVSLQQGFQIFSNIQHF